MELDISWITFGILIFLTIGAGGIGIYLIHEEEEKTNKSKKHK